MKIPKTVAKFKEWARKTRSGSDCIIGIGSCVVYNLARASKDPDQREIQRALLIVAEECAIRWEKAAKR